MSSNENKEIVQINKFDLIQEDLITFLQARIQKATSTTSLKEQSCRVLLERLIAGEDDNEDETERLPTSTIIRIVEVLGKLENEDSSNILGVLKESQKVIIQNNIKDNGKKEEDDFSKDEVQKTKKLLTVFDLVEDMKKTEYSDEELKKLK